ncbi:MAG: hypothetical protein HC842_01150 [Cytophagales bacterium]|nr:hypothetical protein [Cytophagales bacterium]
MDVLSTTDTRFSLYVNPSSIGGAEPATADASHTDTNSFRFRDFSFYPRNDANSGAMDELRFGRTYADVTPIDADPPTLDPVANASVNQSADVQTVNLTGIGDGGTGQTLTLEATSSDETIVNDIGLDWDGSSSTATLSYKTPGGYGTATVEVEAHYTVAGIKVSKTISFEVEVKNASVNLAPTLDAVATRNVLSNAGEQTVELTGISDGNDNAVQTITSIAVLALDTAVISVVSDITASLDAPAGTAQLKFTPRKKGSSRIRIKVMDDGGTATLGVDSLIHEFTVNVFDPPVATVSGVNENFETAETTAEGSFGADPAHYTRSLEDGALKIEIDKSTAATNGVVGFSALNFSFQENNKLLNLGQHPYVQIRVKTDNTVPIEIAVQDRDGRYNPGVLTKTVEGTGEYVTLVYDFTNKFRNGDGEPIDSTQIKNIFINFKPGWQAAGVYVGTVWFSDFRLGAAVELDYNRAPTLDQIPNLAFSAAEAGSKTLNLTGISAGEGESGQSISSIVATSSDPNVVSISGSGVHNGDGTGTLAYNVTGNSGTTVITLTIRTTAPPAVSIPTHTPLPFP